VQILSIVNNFRSTKKQTVNQATDACVASTSNVIPAGRHFHYDWGKCSRGTAIILHDASCSTPEYNLEYFWGSLGFETQCQLLDENVESKLIQGMII